MGEIAMACACWHIESDHSTREQIDVGYPSGCTAVIVDSPDPRFLEFCACTFSPSPLLVGEAVELPGFESVPVAETKERTWRA